MDKMQFSVYTGTRTREFAVNKKNFLYYAEQNQEKDLKSEEEMIKEAISSPIGGASLEDIPENGRVVIIVDDATRPTPSAKIIPPLVAQIEKRSSDITFVTAPGTHRPLTEEELEKKIGRAMMNKYRVVNIDARKERDYQYIGETKQMKTPLYIHKEVLAADYLIAIGNIAPHNVVGWGGGAKIIQPGVSGRITTEATHLSACYERIEEVFGNENCKARQEIDAIGERVGLDFIANTVLSGEGRVLGLFCGHYLKAHRAGVAFAKKILCPQIPQLADIVIVSAYPCYLDYWQGFKPVGFSLKGVKKGGIVIYLFDPPEGLCGNSPIHKPILEAYLDKDEKTAREDIESGTIKDLVGICNPLCHYQVVEQVQVYCVTDTLSEEDCRLMRFRRYTDVEDAIQDALAQIGEDAQIGIIPCGGETLVRVN